MPGAVGPFLPDFPLLVAMYFPCWLIGMALVEVYARGVLLRRPGAVAGGAVLAIGGLAYRADNRAHGPFDFVWALAIAALMAADLLAPNPQLAHAKRLDGFGRTAAWSYSLYLVHFPIIVLVRAVWTREHELPDGPTLACVGFAATLLAALGSWLLVERPTTKLTRWRPGSLGALAKASG